MLAASSTLSRSLSPRPLCPHAWDAPFSCIGTWAAVEDVVLLVLTVFVMQSDDDGENIGSCSSGAYGSPALPTRSILSPA